MKKYHWKADEVVHDIKIDAKTSITSDYFEETTITSSNGLNTWKRFLKT